MKPQKALCYFINTDNILTMFDQVFYLCLWTPYIADSLKIAS